MKPRGAFTVTEHPNTGGTVSYRVTGTKMTSERVRLNFRTEAEALGQKQRLEVEALNVPPAADLKRTRMTAEQVREAERAFDDLDGRPLGEAIRFYLDNYREPLKVIPLEKAFPEFMLAKKKEGLRPDSLANLNVKVGFLVRAHPSANVCEILPEHVEDVIDGPNRSARSRDNIRRAISGFFTWATDKGYCTLNPMTKVKPIRYDRGEPEILPLPKVRALLDAASSYKEGVTMPYVALGLFCAIRPRELTRLTWDDIDLGQKLITIRGKAAKKRQRRLVEIPDNCIAWLRPHALRKTPLHGKNWRRDFDAVKQSAGYGRASKKDPGLIPWTPDILRHTGISYHLAKHKAEGRTAEWAGNSPDEIHRSYKGLVNPSDVDAFWSIRPGRGNGKIVRFAAAA